MKVKKIVRCNIENDIMISQEGLSIVTLCDFGSCEVSDDLDKGGHNVCYLDNH